MILKTASFISSLQTGVHIGSLVFTPPLYPKYNGHNRVEVIQRIAKYLMMKKKKKTASVDNL